MNQTLADHPKKNWVANLSLVLSPRFDRTAVIRSRHLGPLRIQRPFYPEGELCHLYLLHPPGGLASGDDLTVDIFLEEYAQALITAPGATKFYQSSGTCATVSQRLTVGDNAYLEWLPHETIFFNRTHASCSFDIHVQGNGRFIGWEISGLARPANDERFDCGEVYTRLRFYRNEELVLHETFRVQGDATHQEAASGQRGFPMQGVLLATTVDADLMDSLRNFMPSLPVNKPFEWGMTLLDDLLVVRVLAIYTETIRAVFIPLWQKLRPHLAGREAVLPRIWET